MSGYVLSSEVVLDREDIWDYIATDSIDAADRWIAKLFDAFKARGRRTGHRAQARRPHRTSDFFWAAGAYPVIDRTQPRQPVEIVAVTQGSRDIPAFLRRRLH